MMNCHVQQKVKVEKTVCDEASVVPWEVHSRDKVQRTEKSEQLRTTAKSSGERISKMVSFCQSYGREYTRTFYESLLRRSSRQTRNLK